MGRYHSSLTSVPDTLADDFRDIDRLIPQQGIVGGTTATHIRVYHVSSIGRRVVCHNVGDSPAFLITPSLRQTHTLTTTHSIDNEDEKRRMFTAGMIFIDGHFYPSNCHYGLAVTRTLGDARSGVHFNAEPSQSQITLRDDEPRILLAGTDGVFSGYEPRLKELFSVAVDAFYQKVSMDALAAIITKKMVPLSGDNASVIAAII